MNLSSVWRSPVIEQTSRHDDEATLSLVGQVLDKGFALMRFPSPLEDQFLQDGALARRRHFLISGAIALMIYNGFLVVDYLMARDVFWLAVQLRLFLLTPVSMLGLYLFSRQDSLMVRALPPIVYEVIVVGSGLAAAASLAFILSETHSPFAHFYHVGFIVVIMYGNLVQRLRFWYAVVFSLALLGIHVSGVVLLHNVPPRVLWPIVLLVTSTAAFSLTANYAMERDERKRYLLTRRERGVVRELTQVHERLQELSRVDDLTGLYNRRYFQEYLHQVWARAQYDRSPVSILMVDVDHFKKYNDRYGHPAGDDSLRQVAKVLQAELRRPGDVIARYGGEEFIALLPQTDASFALIVAERVRHVIEALHIRHEGSSTSLSVTVSIGVAACAGDFMVREPMLIAAADQALYEAKREGRNRVCFQEMPSAPQPDGTQLGRSA
jgi:diguanylate cyclase (GGDEF)-like protein